MSLVRRHPVLSSFVLACALTWAAIPWQSFFAPGVLMVRTTSTLEAVKVRVPGDTAYAVDVTTSVGAARVGVVEDAASKHRIEVRTEVGAVSIESAT
jgi:hypothetical protein